MNFRNDLPNYFKLNKPSYSASTDTNEYIQGRGLKTIFWRGLKSNRIFL